MFDGSTPAKPSFRCALKASGFIGAWETNVAAGRSVLDAGAAGLMAGDPTVAGQPVSLETALACIHPLDRGWVFDRIRTARRVGGPFSAEFRILAGDGSVRWVLNRGHLPNTRNGTHGYGAYLDTTNTHTLGEVLSLVQRRGLPPPDPLDAAAEHALAARVAIDGTDRPRLRMLVDMLLLEMGRTLARRSRI